MKLIIDISKDRYDEIMAMDWRNCRRFFDEEIRSIHDGMPQMTGHWIECEDEVKCFCSECKEISDYPTKFCPNCGAKMVEPQESEEISREEIAALLARGSEEMTREDAIEALEKEPFMNKPCISEGVCHDLAVQMLDNAISRTRAMETFAHWAEHKDYTHVERHILHAVVDELRAMPSISDQPDEWTPILKDLYNGLEEGS